MSTRSPKPARQCSHFSGAVGRPPSGLRPASACPSCGPSAISAGPDHGSYALKIPEMGGAVAAASQSCTPATVISLPAVSVVAWPMHLKVRARMIEAFSASGKPRFGLITYTSPQPLLSLQELQHHVFGWLLSCTAALL